jgi:hypothetical protein
MQIGIFFIEDVVVDGCFGINNTLKELKKKLRLPNLKPIFYNVLLHKI